ncbi:MAG TPA: RNA-binding protein [Ktedonobacteraceae bacterium]|jgi:RNA recognition motif-containing protein|nr:RNA-binding protein [Ktedonobacteraceae bacterium]
MRLYVGGLPYQTTEDELINLFQQVGNVATATIIFDRATGRSKGFGFVEMDDTQEAQDAIARLNGTTFGNRTITVNEAQARPAGGSRGGGYQNRGHRDNGGYRDRY